MNACVGRRHCEAVGTDGTAVTCGPPPRGLESECDGVRLSKWMNHQDCCSRLHSSPVVITPPRVPVNRAAENNFLVHFSLLPFLGGHSRTHVTSLTDTLFFGNKIIVSLCTKKQKNTMRGALMQKRHSTHERTLNAKRQRWVVELLDVQWM